MIKKVVIGLVYLEKIIIYLYLIVLVVGHIPNNLYKIYKNYNIITNIYRIQDIDSNLCGMFCVLFCLYKVDSKNKFISFLNLFNPNNFLKNELI